MIGFLSALVGLAFGVALFLIILGMTK